MKKQFVIRYSLLAGLVGLLILFTVATVSGAGPSSLTLFSSVNEQQQGACNLNTVKGTYIFEARGTVNDEEGNPQSYAEAGIWTLDGKGNTSGFVSVAIDGVAVADKQFFQGTYTHVGNCIYTESDDTGLSFDLFATQSGSKMTYYSPGFSGTMFRQ